MTEQDGAFSDTDRSEVAQATRIALRPIASPLPLGFFAFGLGSGLLSVQQLGAFTPAQAQTLTVTLAVLVFGPQLLAAVFSYLAREPVAATALSIIAFSWPTTAVVTAMGRPDDPTSPVVGTFSLAVAAFLAVLGPVGLLGGKPVLGTVVVLGTARYALNGLYELTGLSGIRLASAVVGVLIFAIALYGGLALTLEDAKHRTVLPFPRLGEARRAMQTDLVDQAASVSREAGVRRQL